MSGFLYSDDNKRYHTWNYDLRHRFGCKVLKLPLNAGVTCPNLDGSKGVGGCTYCSPSGSGDFAGNPQMDVVQQFLQMKERIAQKGQGKYIAYFQARTNTYAPVHRLREVFEPVLRQPDVVGLSIATRADCLSGEVLDYLQALSQRTFLVVELGLQTVHDCTGERINRCHSYSDFLQGLGLLRERGILVCVHLINGLPGETHEMMVETARRVADLEVQFLKIHLLHVLRGTSIAGELERGEFSLLTQAEYVSIVCDQLEVLPPGVVIQRLTGDGDAKTLIGPLWSIRKRKVLNEIDKELVRRDSWQGKYSEKKA